MHKAVAFQVNKKTSHLTERASLRAHVGGLKFGEKLEKSFGLVTRTRDPLKKFAGSFAR